MRASAAWLRELAGIDASPDEMAERLTRAGIEVEAVTRRGEGLDGVVIGEVRAKDKHPKRDKLTLVRVFDGAHELDVVCGASNVPAPGGRVIFARVGAHLPNGMHIAERDVAGARSCGMICSEAELDIGPDADGIVVVDDATSTAKPGTPVADALGLREAVLEISLTPNRPDGLGHVGLARELALAYGVPFGPRQAPALPVAASITQGGVGPVTVEIVDEVPRDPSTGARPAPRSRRATGAKRPRDARVERGRSARSAPRIPRPDIW
jgi:phenylalanyl-tRNA synthetase beta chain